MRSKTPVSWTPDHDSAKSQNFRLEDSFSSSALVERPLTFHAGNVDARCSPTRESALLHVLGERSQSSSASCTGRDSKLSDCSSHSTSVLNHEWISGRLRVGISAVSWSAEVSRVGKHRKVLHWKNRDASCSPRIHFPSVSTWDDGVTS